MTHTLDHWPIYPVIEGVRYRPTFVLRYLLQCCRSDVYILRRQGHYATVSPSVRLLPVAQQWCISGLGV